MDGETEFDVICDEFEAGIRLNEGLRVKSFLVTPFSTRLLTELLEIELEVLHQRGMLPTKSDYDRWFPRHSQAVGSAFAAFEARFADEFSPTVVTSAEACRHRVRLDLCVVAGAAKGAHCSSQQSPIITAGRSSGAALSLGEEHECSRLHCQFVSRDGSWDVEDLGSRNGTFVNGRRVTKSQLSDGDIVRIGNAQIAVRIRTAADAEESIGGEGQSTQVKTIGPYSIRERLGEGAMGVVFLGVHQRTGELCAIKLIRPEVGEGLQARQLFLRDKLPRSHDPSVTQPTQDGGFAL